LFLFSIPFLTKVINFLNKMKIVFISMHSIHSTRWIENLNNSEFELYWFDINNQGFIKTSSTVKQITNWKKRLLPHIKGEYFLSKNYPRFYNFIRPVLEVTENNALGNIIKEIQPDIIHSFEMQTCSYPILKTMNKFPDIKWIYSCWGSDLYYFQNIKNHNIQIRNVLKRVNYIHTDCIRDYEIAIKLGFKGLHTGVIPGGTGYDLQAYTNYKIPIQDRKIILIKGYQHFFGRAITVIKAIQDLKDKLDNYEVVVFGAHQKVINYIEENNLNIKVYHRNYFDQLELIKLMGKSLIYIGNSISDGIPNTLLEATFMEAFPIQSNPGNVTSEIINNGENGFLIENPNDSNQIKVLIEKTISNSTLLLNASKINATIAIERLDYKKNQVKVVAIYNDIKKK
jgi:glycosyltransferase involved in cell wall biosynthesis